MKSLRQAIIRKELLLVSLRLLLDVKLLINDFHELLLELILQGSHLRRHNVLQFLLNGQLHLSYVVEGGLELDEVLQVRLRDLIERGLPIEVYSPIVSVSLVP